MSATSLNASTLYTLGAPLGAHNSFQSLQTNGSASSLFTLGDGSVSFNGGLAYRASDNTFFAIGNDWLGNSSLVKFNASGASSLVTVAPLGTGFLGGLAYNPDDQRFYAIANDNLGNSSLYSFSDNGVLSAPNPLGAGFYGSLTYNPNNQLLYAVGLGPGVGAPQRGFYSINPSNPSPSVQLLFALGNGAADYGAGLAWDSDNSQFYALEFDGWNPFSLVTFNLGGANTLATAGALPPMLYRGLVLLAGDAGGGNGGGGDNGDDGGNGGGGGGGDPNPIPEPSAWVTLSAGLVSLAALGRQRASRHSGQAPVDLNSVRQATRKDDDNA